MTRDEYIGDLMFLYGRMCGYLGDEESQTLLDSECGRWKTATEEERVEAIFRFRQLPLQLFKARKARASS